jgi:valyl-tRNA synthetase
MPEFEDQEAELRYELLVGASRGARSLTSEYAIKESGSAFVQALDSTTHEVLSLPTTLPSLRSLTGKTVSNISILSPSEAAPTGCAVYTVGSSATVYLDVKGRIEIDKEIIKAQDRLKKANETVEKQKKIMAVENWEEKASDVVKEAERN